MTAPEEHSGSTLAALWQYSDSIGAAPGQHSGSTIGQYSGNTDSALTTLGQYSGTTGKRSGSFRVELGQYHVSIQPEGLRCGEN